MAGCYYCFFLADLLRSFAVLEQFSARSAGPVFDVARLGAGLSFCFRFGQFMAGCDYCIFLIVVSLWLAAITVSS